MLEQFTPVRILEQIHARGNHRLYALTNWSQETFPIAQERFGFWNCLKALSFRAEKLAKPDPRIYTCCTVIG